MRAPYRLQVVLHLEKHKLLTEAFRDRVERELRDGLQAALGDLARVEVTREHPRLKDVVDKGLRQALDGWKERSEVKTHFVLLDFSGVYYEIQARQHDGLTGQASPVVRFDRTPDREFVPRLACLLVEHDFGLVGTFPSWPRDAEETVKLELKGGGLGVPLGRWVHKGEVFSIVQIPNGGPARSIPWALVQVQEPPRDDAPGMCTGRIFRRHDRPSEAAGVLGYRCLKLGTGRSALHVRFLQAGPKGTLDPLEIPLSLQVRHGGFSGEDGTLVQGETDPSGAFDTARLGEAGLFDHVAFVSVTSGKPPRPRVPVPLVDEQPVLIPVPPASGSSDLLGFRIAGWQRDVADSYLVQVNLFKEIETLAAKPSQTARVLEKARDGLKRTQDDFARLDAEGKELKREVQALPANTWNLAREEKILKELKEGEAVLQNFIVRQAKIEEEENDPRRKEMRAQVERAQLLEKDFEYGKAIEIYEKILADGFEAPDLRTHLAKLRDVWAVKDEDHRLARAFIYNLWPDLDTAGLEQQKDVALKSLATCKRVGDVIALQKMFKATEAHVLRMTKELGDLKPEVNVEDEKPATRIKELTPVLENIARDITSYLKTRAGSK